MLLKKEEVIKMFQNLNETEKTKENNANSKNILANVISKKYIILYIITFMISTINMGYNISPFSIAIVTAAIANEIPIIAILILAGIGNVIGTGGLSLLNFIFIFLLFFVSILLKEPIYNEQTRNEKVFLSKRIFFASLIVNIVKILTQGFLIYDLLVAICMSILVVIFYKIFVNSLQVITNYDERMAFSIEEIMGASLMLAISLCCFGEMKILGFSIRNILSIFIVLVLGWKNGILIGTTAGATIGVTLGIISNNEPIVVAAYTISGMIAGILNKFGKIGVILGFIFGNIILSYVSNGLVVNVILIKEILIAGIALLVIPNGLNIKIEDMFDNKKLLPISTNRGLDRSKDTINKLNSFSKVVKDMANTYKKVAGTTIDEQDIKEKNKQKFITELLNNLDNMKENILFDIIENVESNSIDEIFSLLLDKQFIADNDLLKILTKNNNCIVDMKDNATRIDVERMTNAINSAYRISKMNFIWNIKINEEKKNFETQLNGVSRAISELAENINSETELDDTYNNQTEQIRSFLKQKRIFVREMFINKKDGERFNIELFIEDYKIDEKYIINIISKVLKEKVIIKDRKVMKNEKLIKYNLVSDDKYILDIGMSVATKDRMPVSGDTVIQTHLKDGKYLIILSDGMGSGIKARENSKILTSMLQRLLESGFEKETSIEIINSNLISMSEDEFATLDMAIIDLYNGSIEFIKNGACPTYFKSGKKIQIIKSQTLPTGVINNISTDVFDKDLENEDIFVMCSDGILESNVEFKNKELWIKYLIEDMEISNAKKMSDIILNESIDNNYGKIKDDMSVIVGKIIKKTN